ncbi:MAG: oxidoreductase [Actinomycetes bacterium]|nr:MAG: oxidoreductase [Actinomycetes bacterium]
MRAPVEERFVEVDGIRLFLRERRGEGPPIVYFHGNPTDSGDWLPFIAASTEPAIALDLPGFGRSERPDPSVFDSSVGAYGRLLANALAALAPGGYKLVVHDWGVVGLVASQARPEAVRALVVINAVPLSATYRWHFLARCWRRRGIGELLARPRPRWLAKRMMRLARPGRRPLPGELVERMLANWDAGMARSILALYRSADGDVLAAAGDGLAAIRCPALILWGELDPYIGPADGRSFERRISGARFVTVERAGHWPWIDRPELVDEVIDFLADPGAPPPG